MTEEQETYDAGKTARLECLAGLDTSAAFDTLKAAILADRCLARSWHANVAMSFVFEGGNHTASNKAAARFMYTAFGVDTSWCVTEACGDEARSAPTEQQVTTDPDAIDAFRLLVVSAKTIEGRAPTRMEFVVRTDCPETINRLLQAMRL